MNKEKFESYVEIQKSGVTNMWFIDVVSELSGLDRDEVLDIIKNYGKYKEKYGDKK